MQPSAWCMASPCWDRSNDSGGAEYWRQPVVKVASDLAVIDATAVTASTDGVMEMGDSNAILAVVEGEAAVHKERAAEMETSESF